MCVVSGMGVMILNFVFNASISRLAHISKTVAEEPLFG